MDINVVRLTGEVTTDLNLIEAGHVILTTTVHWDMLSRKWKQRKLIQSIALYVFDDLQLIGGVEGPTYEVVVSRARFIASQLETPQRIVGLATSLANAKDVGDWIGASGSNTYNFAPDVRPVALDIHIQSFDMNHFNSRLLAMAKPTYNAIIKYSPGKPALVFVPSRKQAQLSAIDLVSFAAAGGAASACFLNKALSDTTDNVVAEIKDVSLGQTCMQGVGFLHSGLLASDRAKVEYLFNVGALQVLIVPYSMCWSVRAAAHLVVVMDTVYYEGREHRYVDYPSSDILKMLGKASRQNIDSSAKCLLLCHSPKRDYLKKMIHDPLPIESHLDHYLHDHINAEVVSHTIENKPDAVDYLTWTFYYKRLVQNPNYYNLQGVSHRHISDQLSDLIEAVVSDLAESKCLAVEEDDVELSALNLGMIASHYYIEYTTVELFASSLNAKTKIKGVLEILASSSEFSHMSIRQYDDAVLTKLSQHLPQVLPDGFKINDPATKALILMQCHFSRITVTGDLVSDQSAMLADSIKLLQALVDVISSNGWLRPALAAMEVAQMLTQGLWSKDSSLMQIPHFTAELVERFKSLAEPVESVLDLIDMEDDARNDVLHYTPEKLYDMALFCNAYPNVDVSFNIEGSTSSSGDAEEDVSATAAPGDAVVVRVRLSRDVDEDIMDVNAVNSLGKVISPRFPVEKRECWWLVVGDPHNNTLLSIKRVALMRDTKVCRHLKIYVIIVNVSSYIDCKFHR